MTTTYTVQPGDSLSLISKKFYGSFDFVDMLAATNKITIKDLIFPGQQLLIPDGPIQEAVVIASSTQEKKGKGWLWAGLAGLALAIGVGVAVHEKNKKKGKKK